MKLQKIELILFAINHLPQNKSTTVTKQLKTAYQEDIGSIPLEELSVS
jgi:hypothetical protein